MLCVSLSFGALFTWISNSAFVVIDHFGVAPERFGLVFGAVVVGYVSGAYGGSRAGMRFDLARATGIGSAICAAAGAGLLLAGSSGLGGLYAITALMALSFFGAVSRFRRAPRAASAPFPSAPAAPQRRSASFR